MVFISLFDDLCLNVGTFKSARVAQVKNFQYTWIIVNSV